MSRMKVLLNDINIAENDCLTARRDNMVYVSLQQLNRRVNAEFFKIRSLLRKRSLEKDNVKEILDFALEEQDVEAIRFYQTRNAQLDALLSELHDAMSTVDAKMQYEYVELTDEEFQIFTQVNDWSYLMGKNRTEFYKSSQK